MAAAGSSRSPQLSRSPSPPVREDISDSELFDELEKELDDETQLQGFDMGEYRQRRMVQLQNELASRPRASSSGPNANDLGIDTSQMGRYIRLDTEREAIRLLEKSGRRVVLHFSHAEFQRCKIVDTHLETLAAMHPTTLFLAVSPLKAPFLVQKMDVKVLPRIVCFVDGKAVDNVVGFEELGNTDSFSRVEFEERLGKSGVLVPRSKQNADKPVFGFGPGSSGQDVDDWD
ncbi:unnamed protein product [Jaminaea pallidilutea]